MVAKNFFLGVDLMNLGCIFQEKGGDYVKGI